MIELSATERADICSTFHSEWAVNVPMFSESRVVL